MRPRAKVRSGRAPVWVGFGLAFAAIFAASGEIAYAEDAPAETVDAGPAEPAEPAGATEESAAPDDAPAATGRGEGLPDRLAGGAEVPDLLGLGPPDIAAEADGTPSPLDLWLRRPRPALDLGSIAYPRRIPPKRLRGSVRVRYRGQMTDEDDDDQDLYEYLNLDYGDPFAAGWSGSFSGRLTQDLDEFGDADGFFAFDDITDTYPHRINGRIYHAWVGYRPRGPSPLAAARLGRQFIDAGEVLLVDGAWAESAPIRALRGASVHAFGGVPAHLFETSPDGDWTAGIGVDGEPWCGATASFDYVHIEDRNDYYGALRNDLFTVELRQRIGRHGSAWVRYQHLNAHPRYVDLTYDGYFPRSDLTIRARASSLLYAQRAEVYDLDAYYAILQTLEPYGEVSLSAAKGFGPRFYVEAGATARWLFDEDTEGPYNHEFQRGFLTLGSTDWPWRCWSAFLTGELWTGDEDIATASFEVEWEPSRCWRFRVGSDYQLYRPDFYGDVERLDSRAVYLEGRWKPSDHWRFSADVRLETDDYYTYVIVNAAATYTF